MIQLYNHSHPTSYDPKANTGLWFDRFCPVEELANFKNSKRENEKPDWLSALEYDKVIGDRARIENFCSRHNAMITAIGGKSLAFRADWHFVTGMGNPHPLENGFQWHHLLGVPYLTGAAVKGLLRSTIDIAYDDPDTDKSTVLYNWFGGKTNLTEVDEPAAGQLIFFDAIPLAPPMVGLDVLSPHMGKWYLEGGVRPNEADTTPADWHDPDPVKYLVAKEMTLMISFAPRQPCDIDLEDVSVVIEHALKYEGVGAKNRVGYGYFSRDADTEQMWQKEQRLQLEKLEEQAKTETMSDVEAKIYHHIKKNGLPDAIYALDDGRLYSNDEKAEAATVLKQTLISDNSWNVQPHKKFVKNKPYVRVQIVKKYLSE